MSTFLKNIAVFCFVVFSCCSCAALELLDVVIKLGQMIPPPSGVPTVQDKPFPNIGRSGVSGGDSC